MGELIDLHARRARRDSDADGEAARARMAARVQAAGGRQRLARLLTDRLGWLVRPSHVAAWETTVTPPGDVLLAAQSVTRRTPAGAAVRPVVEWDGHAAFMQSLRDADRRTGGQHLYPTVVDYLQSDVAPHLFGVGHDGDGRGLFTAAAGLTEMAGWMAHDAGDDAAAGKHFARSLDLVRLGSDRQLEVHVLASMSHLAHHRDDARTAVRLARQGRKVLADGPRTPELESRLLAMQARGHAALGQPAACGRALAGAERALTAPAGEARSAWVSHFDEGSLAVEAARCFHRLGDFTEAGRQAERVIALRPAGRARSRAFGQLLLAAALVGRGLPDEACGVVREVIDGTAHLGSALVMRQVLDLRRQLAPHRRDRDVADFLGCLESTLHERGWQDGARR